ncbi:transcriptional regulator/sugar kinase [Mycobacteroides abscessus subsp. abscessus]|nr:transcriptional regulator/sugar kinase [Mycobacteroides abscessus subsp. abscessus]
MSRTGNLDFIKRMNRTLVLETIRNEQPISRAKVAKSLGLSRSTVSLIVDELLAKKFVTELGLGDSTKEGGRRGIELGFNPKSAYGLGIEIGDKGILHILTDLNGEIYKEQTLPLTNKMNEIIGGILQFLDELDIDQQLILGLGITVPSIVDSTNAIVIDAPLLGWKDFNVKEHMQGVFPFPVFVHNDVNSAALGERWLGNGKETMDMFYIAFGSGVGSSIIANGQLILGHSYSAGEIGYFLEQTDIEKGILNKKGEFGSLESKFTKWLEDIEKKKLDSINMDEIINYLSITLANVVSLLNPEKIIIGGVKASYFDSYVGKIEKNVSQLSTYPVTVNRGCLEKYASPLGAIKYVFEQIQETI